jgi:uncharacterized membrane protein (DUF485 family)
MHINHKNGAPETVGEAQAARHARTGLALFAVYSLFYLTFMLLNAFAPARMRETVWGGINLAVVYGMGLIAAAFVLALAYLWLCRGPGEPDREEGRGQ